MIRKYLTTPEEILALKGTGTKIYVENLCNYYRFIDGCLCWFNGKGDFDLNATIHVGKDFQKKYILVEEPVKEATEEDEGKLCWFWDDEEKEKNVGILLRIDTKSDTEFRYIRESQLTTVWKHCRRLTPAEVAEITGYKVEE